MTDNNKYSKVIERIGVITKWILFELAERVSSKKEIYLRNSLAKGYSLLASIDLLYLSKNYNEGWILFRSLLDRFVYIIYLCENDCFNEFESWSFIKKYEYNNSIRSDEKFTKVLKDPLLKLSKDQTKKYYTRKKEQINWVKPNPEIILRSRELDFLYKYGYNYASGHTHPMFGDGGLEFHNLTGLKPNPYDVLRHEDLVKNSILVNALIQREVFNKLRFKFRGVLHSYLDETLPMINNEPNKFDQSVLNVLSFIQREITLFEE